MDLSVRDILDRLEPIIAFGRQVFLETGDRHVADLNAEESMARMVRKTVPGPG